MNGREGMDPVFRRVLIPDGGLATLLLSEKVPGRGFCPEGLLLEAFDDVAANRSRYVRPGVRLAGGCCGTAPAPISALGRALL